ncbi:MAG: Ig-like domain-containing protein [candidate division Zixibacteria bacterium]|nr:Ig-like domain-containing protein [candidate division Zixibacteria bacterium]
MKKILILLIIAGLMLLAVFSCNKRETNPIETNPDISDFNPGVNPLGYFDIVTEPTGGPLSRPEGMAVVDSDAPEAKIGCEFATRLDSATIDSAFSLVNTSGSEIALVYEFNFGPHTAVYIRPAADLDYNTTYILSISAALLKNEAGDMLDVDGDGVGGETPDDNLSCRFTTHFQGDSFSDRDNDDVYDGQVDSNGDHVWEDVNSEGETIGETFIDESPYNNIWDDGEVYVDDNSNGSYDAGERYTDNNFDSAYTANAENLDDSNHNDYADLGEFFSDADGDSVWDAAESYTDLNFNGSWDNTELRYDYNSNGIYDVGDGDTYLDIETENGICDYAEPFVNANNDSVAGPAYNDTINYLVPHWNNAESVSGGYDYNNNGEYDAGTFLIPDGAEAWNPMSVDSRLVYYNGNWVSRRFCGFAEEFTDANNDSIWNPADEFIDIISNGVWDAAPEVLTTDVNGDGMYDTAYAGIPVPQTDDDIPPAIIRNAYYLIGDNEVSTKWLDVSIAIDIADSAYDAAGNRIQQALPSAAFDATNVILRDDAAKVPVECAISYDNVAASTTYLRLLINPTGNLAAGKAYEIVLKAQSITDAEGNKLLNTSDITYIFTTTNSTSDGNTVVDDITPPTETFTDNGPTFTIEFSEEIDVATISAATIAVTYQGDPNSGRFVIGTVENGSSPTGLATTVTFYPNNSAWNSGEITVRSPIRDLAGNIKGNDTDYNWF